MKIEFYLDAKGFAPLTEWLNTLKDRETRAVIRTRLTRLAAGNFGDVKFLRGGVSELRIDFGPGYRVYVSRQASVLVVLLSGGSKRTQDKDIDKAVEYLNDWKQRA